MKNKLKLLVNFLVSVAILYVLFLKMDSRQLTLIWSNGNHLLLFAVLFLFIPQFVLSGARWQIVLNRAFNVDIALREGIAQVLASYTLNLFIPGKVGEVVRLMWMKGYPAYKHGRGVYLLLLEKYFDLFVLLTFAGLGMILRKEMLIGLIFTFVVMISLFAYFKMHDILNFFPSLNKRLLFLDDFNFTASKVQPLKMTWVYSFILWAIQIIQMYFIVIAFTDSHIPFLVLFSGLPLVVLSGVIPLTFMGIGARESVVVFLFQQWVDKETLILIGVLLTLRVILTNIAGLSFFYELQGRRNATS